MHDFTAKMMRENHANYMRWMHISPQRVDAERFCSRRYRAGLSGGR